MIKEAIILAGGKGTRLQSVVKDVPKPLAPVAGHPFLHYLIRQLKNAGVTHYIFSTGYKSEKGETYIQRHQPDLNCSCAVEKTALGTGGGVRFAVEKCQHPHTLVVNGDTFLDLDFEQFSKFHTQCGYKASLALKEMPTPDRYGTVTVDDSKTIVAFKEKTAGLNKGIINAGIYALEVAPFKSRFQVGEVFSLEQSYFEPSVEDKILGGYLCNGYFIDIGIPEDYERAQQYFKPMED